VYQKINERINNLDAMKKLPPKKLRGLMTLQVGVAD
jgi:hypothetical protein